MTSREKELLVIAKEIISINKDIGAALTGSLLLAYLGIGKRREANDIDIIAEYLCENHDGFPNMPKGWELVEMDGRKSQVDAISFIKDGIKIDFMQSNETVSEKYGIMCASVDEMIAAKKRYIKNDKSEYSREKHALDLNIIKHV